MSRIHISFVKLAETSSSIVYRVESPDFADTQLIGEITFKVPESQYHFVPMGALFGRAVIPPNVFDLPDEQQSQIIARDFVGHSYGGWTSRIARMASRLLEEGEFPNEVLGVT